MSKRSLTDNASDASDDDEPKYSLGSSSPHGSSKEEGDKGQQAGAKAVLGLGLVPEEEHSHDSVCRRIVSVYLQNHSDRVSDGVDADG
jgi:hypothetical protein